jgi:hypothetical protein
VEPVSGRSTVAAAGKAMALKAATGKEKNLDEVQPVWAANAYTDEMSAKLL